jgi:hypothetical protein
LFELAYDNKPGSANLSPMSQWWRENCLYLAPAASEAFIAACGAAEKHRVLLAGRVASSKLEENWNIIKGACETIASAVQLPGIGPALIQTLIFKADGQFAVEADRSTQPG